MNDSTVFIGNLDLSSVVALGTPVLVEAKSRELITLFGDTHRFILNAGCASRAVRRRGLHCALGAANRHRARHTPTSPERIAHRGVDCRPVLRQPFHWVFQAPQGQHPARRPRTAGLNVAQCPLPWQLPAARPQCLVWRSRTDAQRIAYR